MIDQMLTDWIIYKNTHPYVNVEMLWRKWIRSDD